MNTVVPYRTADNKHINNIVGRSFRIKGIVQGVGFRPMVWRLASKWKLKGEVYNDGQGVVINVWGSTDNIAHFSEALPHNVPPLARIDSIQQTVIETKESPCDFRIRASESSAMQTHITADAAVCTDCLQDIYDPMGRRYRYALTNCTHCGPRFSIIKTIPYDRSNTSMKKFALCATCRKEYTSPQDRRFHAQPNACYDCGPRVVFERMDGKAICLESYSQLDAVDAACTALQNGSIVAIKGIGGFHLACDASNDDAVLRLRQKKHRYAKAFALMARDLDVIQRYAQLTDVEETLLSSAEAPIVLLPKSVRQPSEKVRTFGQAEGLRAKDLKAISEHVAPRQNTLGFMLPYTPIHHLMLKRMNRPIVLTSANLSDEPQLISNEAVKTQLAEIADYVLWHDRDIINRVDDSVVRVMARKPRLLRRARGYAPSSLPLPAGFEHAPAILAMGGELKNTFCLLKDGHAILSQHMGDLENAVAFADYQHNLALYANLFQHTPERIVIDAHPEYLSSKVGRQRAEERQIECHVVQHHHAHIAACLAENQYPINGKPVLGVALDGLGYGVDGCLWGGEFLRASYTSAKRLGTFKPVALLGGAMAVREPWRNTYAHLMAEMGWPALKMNFDTLDLIPFFESKPLDTFNAMLKKGTHSPPASSCGRLFDAVAAAMGICRHTAHYEGQAATELEAIVDMDTLHYESELLAYPFSIPFLKQQLPYIEPLAMWQALLGDLILDTPKPVMAARFHKGLAKSIVAMIKKLTHRDEQRYLHTVALSGGVFQNKVLFEQVLTQLEKENFTVLTHQHVPANDSGISLGQAVIGAAQYLKTNPVNDED